MVSRPTKTEIIVEHYILKDLKSIIIKKFKTKYADILQEFDIYSKDWEFHQKMINTLKDHKEVMKDLINKRCKKVKETLKKYIKRCGQRERSLKR